MPPPSIPKHFTVTPDLRARYLEGWRDGLAGREHLYSTKFAADIFRRQFGPRQLDAYNAGYEAGVGAKSE
jgi:ribosome modulation factor